MYKQQNSYLKIKKTLSIPPQASNSVVQLTYFNSVFAVLIISLLKASITIMPTPAKKNQQKNVYLFYFLYLQYGHSILHCLRYSRVREQQGIRTLPYVGFLCPHT